MASTPDSSTLTSSAQIFSANHTLPQIRLIHKSLHVQVEEKSNRLRTQVGSSYRELLGTSDTIVQMRGDNDRVQDLLGKVGGRCGRTIVASKTTGLEKFVMRERNMDAGEAARLRLLDSCGLMVGRILRGQGGLDVGVKRGDRLVLATKVWVLSRLLIKSFEEEAPDESAKHHVETARKTQGTLRRRLLSGVKKVLEKADEKIERGDVLKALCAYSLVTSSGAWDVLRHFLSVRGEAMALAFDLEAGERATTTEDVVRSLKLYTQTLLDVQALVPAKLSPALPGLKSSPLLADPSLKRLEGLRLDVYERWCSEEIQYFTPFIRHDDLDGKRARDILTGWAKKGGEVLLKGLHETLEHMADFKSIMELRTQVLQLWIRDGGRARGFDPLEMQDDLRNAINARMLAVLETKVTKLRLVGSEVRATLEGWQEGVTDKHPGLWDEDGYDTMLSKGAAPFVREVVSRLYGRSDAVSRAVHSYSSWFLVIDDVKDVVERLRKQRWDNDYDEIEDEETIEARQQALSKDDPRKLRERLDTTLDKSFSELEEQLGNLWEEKAEGPTNGAIAMYLIRILRDIRSQLPERSAIEDFGLAIVPGLHNRVAVHVATPAMDDFAATALSDRKVPGKPLWEGDPPLPNQPSPGIFRFLQNLSLSMTDAGVDLWTAAAVEVVKKHLCEQLGETWRTELFDLSAQETTNEDKDGEKTSGDDKGPGKGPTVEEGKQGALPTAKQIRDLCVQWLFDASFLQCCVGNISGTPSGVLKSLEDEIYKHTGLDDQTSRQRISKASQDYWQRTSLLFGLLA
ncbi:Conserved oligomeric Golgi complex subunit 1 [Tolypocladium ophioglossoides CBS 100239]|uniref:Conserved oligomeric Golgi complex subunit 1 n=1 Tax=Tolypocladium ophioglossoides (strain CBS 100239) TaxID=1163406 RepID=A0A0L0NEZ0_TOLOC|nr:Conserved oligomeric Golgi complex subunit 1 [Tolypocladium ophioglossoides CBS 100239]